MRSRTSRQSSPWWAGAQRIDEMVPNRGNAPLTFGTTIDVHGSPDQTKRRGVDMTRKYRLPALVLSVIAALAGPGVAEQKHEVPVVKAKVTMSHVPSTAYGA